MNFELFIARRINFNKKGNKIVSRRAVRIAVGGIAIGLTVMILAVAIVIGFKQEVRNKLIGFGSHIQISVSFNNQTYETEPLLIDSTIVEKLKKIPEVKHVQKFATQPGIIKTDENFQGIVLKGVDSDFDWNFFKSNLLEGNIFDVSDTLTGKNIIISKKLSDLLQLNVGDDLLTYFIIDGKLRVRPFSVSGIYSTGFSEYDKLFIFGDIKHIRRLNNWNENESSGLEILIKDFNDLDAAYKNVFDVVGNRFDEYGSPYMLRSIEQMNPQIFSWLDLLDMNVVIILILMILVAGFTMISGLMILILEKTNLIGILKAMGTNNWSVRKIFMYQSYFLVGKGMLIGNLIGIAIYLIQKYFKIITLNPDVYYVDSVPMSLSWIHLLLLNLGTFVLSALILIGPSYIITKINPAKSIKFE
jgi:lipoprotein-releasing system permease protein